MKTHERIRVRVSPYAPGEPEDRVTSFEGPPLSPEMITHLLDLGALVLKQQGREPNYDLGAGVEFTIDLTITPSPNSWVE